MWTDVCHRCGTKIFNGIPEGKDIFEYISEMKTKGYIIGYNSDIIGSFGNTETISIKPICSVCSQKDIKTKNNKMVKKGIRKISSEIFKVYVCPLCSGYSDQVYKTTDKTKLIKHLEEKHSTELINIGSDY